MTRRKSGTVRDGPLWLRLSDLPKYPTVSGLRINVHLSVSVLMSIVDSVRYMQLNCIHNGSSPTRWYHHRQHCKLTNNLQSLLWFLKWPSFNKLRALIGYFCVTVVRGKSPVLYLLTSVVSWVAFSVSILYFLGYKLRSDTLTCRDGDWVVRVWRTDYPRRDGSPINDHLQ